MIEPVLSFQDLAGEFQAMLTQMIAYLPKVMMAVAVLVLGWLLARLARVLVVRAIGRLDQLWQRLILKRGLEQLQSFHPPVRVVGELVYWLLLLVFVSLATDILGLGIFGVWLKEIVSYLPLAAAGLLIILVGFVVSSLSRDLVRSAANSAGLTHGDLLGRSAQLIILFIAIILGIDQIGIDIRFLSVVAGIVLVTTLGGVSLAFGLGARTHVSNIIAANQMRQIYQVGDRVRIGDIEGRVAGITVSRVIIETEAGSVDVPAKLFDEQVSIIIERGA
jgi:small-conductance mechanosensitive channel